MGYFDNRKRGRGGRITESLERLRQSMWEALNGSSEVGRAVAELKEVGWNPSLSVDIVLESAAGTTHHESTRRAEAYSDFDTRFLREAGIAIATDPENSSTVRDGEAC